MKKTFIATTALGAILASGGLAQAQDYEPYVSISAGVANLEDSDNDGELTSTFTTGEGTTIPAGTSLPSGTAVGWTTEFDSGYTVSGAYGVDTGMFRFEGELAYAKNDIDTHQGVNAGGIALDNEDAAVLITGQATNLGVTVGDLVAAGEGDVSTLYGFVNGYYDLETDTAFTPYVGVGIGLAQTKVDYSPSSTPIIDDESTSFAYQVMGGASYALNEQSEIFGGIKYRATNDVEVDSQLLPATFDIENKGYIFEAGYRYRF